MKSLAVGLVGFPSAGSLSFGFPRSSFGVLLVTAETDLGSWAFIKGLGFYQAVLSSLLVLVLLYRLLRAGWRAFEALSSLFLGQCIIGLKYVLLRADLQIHTLEVLAVLWKM